MTNRRRYAVHHCSSVALATLQEKIRFWKWWITWEILLSLLLITYSAAWKFLFINDFTSIFDAMLNTCIWVSLNMSFDVFKNYVKENHDRFRYNSAAQHEDNTGHTRTNLTTETEHSESVKQEQAKAVWKYTFYGVYTMRNSVRWKIVH